jgi:hypothetical protein
MSVNVPSPSCEKIHLRFFCTLSAKCRSLYIHPRQYIIGLPYAHGTCEGLIWHIFLRSPENACVNVKDVARIFNWEILKVETSSQIDRTLQ